tara:strand:- start:211 stop:414 length:204 start_codon:yes stop_codon:yes gene_type:complete
MKTKIKKLNELLNEISSNQEKINWLISVIELKDVLIEDLREDKWGLKIDLECKENQIQKLENKIKQL